MDSIETLEANASLVNQDVGVTIVLYLQHPSHWYDRPIGDLSAPLRTPTIFSSVFFSLSPSIYVCTLIYSTTTLKEFDVGHLILFSFLDLPCLFHSTLDVVVFLVRELGGLLLGTIG